MKHPHRTLALFSLLTIAALVLAACAPAVTPTTAPPEPTKPAPTAAPPTAVPPTEPPPTEEPFVGDKVEAPDCDYGGKIASIEAVDRLTVVFNLCKPDPSFLAKAAFIPFGIQPKEWIGE